MKITTHQLLAWALFQSFLLECATSAIPDIAYSPVLENLELTFPGDHRSYYIFSVTICAIICSWSRCDGFSWNEPTMECNIYETLYLYTEPIDSVMPAMVNYLPEDSSVTFIEVINGGQTWYTARDACDNIGAQMIYVPMERQSEGERLFDTYGGFHMGLERTSASTLTWTDHDGRVYELDEIHWDVGQPDSVSYPNCGTWFLRTGVHDVGCTFAEGKIAICLVHNDWRD